MPQGAPELLTASTHTPLGAPATGEKQNPLPQLPQVAPTGEHVTSGRVVVLVVGTTVVVVETGHSPGPGQHVASPFGPTQRHSWPHVPSRQVSRVHGLPSSHEQSAMHASKFAAQVGRYVNPFRSDSRVPVCYLQTGSGHRHAYDEFLLVGAPRGVETLIETSPTLTLSPGRRGASESLPDPQPSVVPPITLTGPLPVGTDESKV
jgi:hypothetical protein